VYIVCPNCLLASVGEPVQHPDFRYFVRTN
jgi:hypothetical protein